MAGPTGAQQLYAFAFGIVYAWLMERSRSLLAPMIAHGLSWAMHWRSAR
jgi:membrane protease YdiL (CAAX protease family)